ncbi:MAG: FAD-dependent monooxygenase [Chitinophagaceae bacterium]|nr:FAD-dependent monooxygenase [Chitinophagaceae bacterium]
MKKNIIIIGAGLVGSLLSIYLKRRGYHVTIYERREDMRLQEMSAGRSINLALSDRGLLALEKIGLAQEIKNICIPMYGRYIHNIDNSTVTQPYGINQQHINSVSRSTLNMKLMSLAEENGVTIHFNHKCQDIDWKKNKITFETGNNQIETVYFDLLFGSDGAFAASRLAHQLQHNKFDYHQYYIDCGYKELTIPPTADGNFAMEVNALHIWPRKDYMLIALPNLDKSFTCTLFFPMEGDLSFSQLDTKEKVENFFTTNFADVIPLMPNYIDDFFNNPTSTLVTVKCFPWIREDKFALIGDAAHALVPFFGQGMNCGFEDCRVLDELIDKHQENWQLILDEFQTLRKPDADAIADLAVYNFVEMRDKTGNAKFLLQKKIETNFQLKYPNKWTPAYSLVTFSPHIRYSEALNRGQQQEAIMQEIMQLENIEEIWNSELVEQMILKKVQLLN